MRRMVIALLACSTVIMSGAQAHAGLPLERVVSGKGEQYRPSANGTYVAWATYLTHRGDVYVMEEGTDVRRRVNASTREATMGSFIAGTDRLVYQQYTNKRSDLYFFDAVSGDRWKAPATVNAPGWEYWPEASSDFLLFLRTVDPFTKRSLLLYNRKNGATRTLIKDIGGKDVFPGFVGARYAAWTSCGAVTCSIFVFDSTSATTQKLPTPDGRADYAPAIDEANDIVYFVRSPASACGRHVSIRSAALGSTDSVPVATLPDGMDTGWNLSLTMNPDTGLQDLYLERWVCAKTQGDIFAVRSVNAL